MQEIILDYLVAQVVTRVLARERGRQESQRAFDSKRRGCGDGIVCWGPRAKEYTEPLEGGDNKETCSFRAPRSHEAQLTP